jgi:hypothetical protein
MKSSEWLPLLAIVAAFCLAACAETFPPCTIQIGPSGGNETLLLYAEPDARSKNATEYFRQEFQEVGANLKTRQAKAYGPADSPASTGSRPGVLIGLALSGGGLRSNAFQLGLLNGLHNVNGTDFSRSGNSIVSALDNIGYISSVSGGSWASAAFMAYRDTTQGGDQTSFRQDTDAFFEMLNETVIRDRALARCAKGYITARDDCANNATRILNNSYEFAFKELSNIDTFLSLIKMNPGRTSREAWREMLLGTHLLGRNRSMTEMLHEGKPFWILNSTHSAESTGNNIHHFPFQITPYGVGSIADCGSTSYCGFHHSHTGFFRTYSPSLTTQTFPPLTVAHAMAMSGAVTPERLFGINLNLLAWDLPLPRPSKDTLVKLAQDSCPAAVKSFKETVPVRDVYVLGDGGHSENFGALALMERKVDLLIISDAGYNPGFNFDDYSNLQHHADKLLKMGFFVSPKDKEGEISWGGEYMIGRERDKSNDLPPRTRDELDIKFDQTVFSNASDINTPMHTGRYGIYDNAADARDVIYIRPPFNIRQKADLSSPFLDYLKRKYMLTLALDAKTETDRSNAMEEDVNIKIANAKSRSCVYYAADATCDKISSDSIAAQEKITLDSTRIFPLNTANATGPTDDDLIFQELICAVAKEPANNDADLDNLIQTSNSTYREHTRDRLRICNEARAQEIALLEKTRNDIQMLRQSVRDESKKIGNPVSGYMSTYDYLTLNETDFPQDKTLVKSYDRELIFAYYLLGTYIGEELLAPKIKEYLAKKIPAPASH